MSGSHENVYIRDKRLVLNVYGDWNEMDIAGWCGNATDGFTVRLLVDFLCLCLCLNPGWGRTDGQQSSCVLFWKAGGGRVRVKAVLHHWILNTHFVISICGGVRNSVRMTEKLIKARLKQTFI